MAETPIIELRKVVATRGDYDILSEVSVALSEGTTTFFMGAAGSGKSSLLKTAAGIRVPDSGQVLFRGKPLSRMTRQEEAEFRRRTAFVFQDAALWGNQSLFDNLALPVRVHEPGWSMAEVERAVRRAVELVGYTQDLRARPAELSLGERRLVGLARALVLDPELLFLDEPSAHLDEPTADRVFDMVAALKGRGRSLAVVSSKSDFASRIADYVGIIDDGRLIAFGPYDEAAAWTDPNVRAVTDRLKVRRPEETPAWASGLAGEWAEALAGASVGPPEEGPWRKASAETSDSEKVTLGDMINAAPVDDEDKSDRQGGKDVT